MTNATLTAVRGIEVGHWTHAEARTGCSVVLMPEDGALASGLVLGGSPGSRDTELLAPEKTVERVHAVLLTGGSAFGLAAADGVMRWLEAHGRGYATPAGRVPIVPAAALNDLGVGDGSVRPDAAAGFAAADAAGPAPVPEGAVGAGAGASVGQLFGPEGVAPGGIGSAAMEVGGATVAVMGVSNAAGSIVDPQSGALVAGSGEALGPGAAARALATIGTNTTLVVVATDAPLSKAEARALAQSAHMGIARVTRPSHTPYDGDTVFAVSTGQGPRVPLVGLAVAAQELTARALLRGVRAAAG